MSVRMRQFIERQIIAAFVRAALAAGHNVSVNDGEETTLWNSRNFSEIMGALMTTDEDHLYLDAQRIDPRDGEIPSKLMGEAAFIYGNSGYDVLSDSHGIPEALFEECNRLSDYWDAEGTYTLPPVLYIEGESLVYNIHLSQYGGNKA